MVVSSSGVGGESDDVVYGSACTDACTISCKELPRYQIYNVIGIVERLKPSTVDNTSIGTLAT